MAAPRPDFLELPVADVTAARDFYQASFGWDMTGFGPSYACTMTGDVDLGLQADAAERTAAPLIAVRVDDVARTLVAVQAAGGTITRETFAFPGGRRFHFRDPAGNELAAYQAE